MDGHVTERRLASGREGSCVARRRRLGYVQDVPEPVTTSPFLCVVAVVVDEQITRSSTAPRLLEVAGASVAVPDIPEPVSRQYKPTFSHRFVRKDTLRTDHMRKGHGYRIPTGRVKPTTADSPAFDAGRP